MVGFHTMRFHLDVEILDVVVDSDACAVPVLTPAEATSIEPSGSSRPAPHPHLTRTPASSPHAGTPITILNPGTHNEVILIELGLSAVEREALIQAGALGEEARENQKVKAKAKL